MKQGRLRKEERQLGRMSIGRDPAAVFLLHPPAARMLDSSLKFGTTSTNRPRTDDLIGSLRTMEGTVWEQMTEQQLTECCLISGFVSGPDGRFAILQLVDWLALFQISDQYRLHVF